MSTMSTDQAEREQGTKNANTYLGSISKLHEAEWDQAVKARISEIEAPFDRSGRPLSPKASAEVGELNRALRNGRNERAPAAMEESDARNDPEWHGGEEDVANWIGPMGTWT